MTDYMTLAIEAKREKDFDLAHEYYSKKMQQDAVSVGLLRAIAKVYYLQGDNYHAVVFNLAGAHLALHEYNEGYKRGDPDVQQAMQQIPVEVVEKFPNLIGALLLLESNTLKHIAHAGVDHDDTYEHSPEFQKYAEAYYAQVLGDGSHVAKLQELNLTIEDQLTYDKERYESLGLNILMDRIEWTKLDDSNVLEIYLQ